MKLSLPRTRPFDTVQVSLSGVIAHTPVWVNGLYWKRYDRDTNGVSGACTSSYSQCVANLPTFTELPLGPRTGKNTSPYAWYRSIGYFFGPPFWPLRSCWSNRPRAIVNRASVPGRIHSVRKPHWNSSLLVSMSL